MIPDVVVWQLMDFLQQIRIPHPLPLDSPRILRSPGISFLFAAFEVGYPGTHTGIARVVPEQSVKHSLLKRLVADTLDVLDGGFS